MATANPTQATGEFCFLSLNFKINNDGCCGANGYCQRFGRKVTALQIGFTKKYDGVHKMVIFFSADSGGAGPQPPQTSENQSGGPNYAENVRGQMFTVGPRYTSLQYIGEGAYGMVV